MHLIPTSFIAVIVISSGIIYLSCEERYMACLELIYSKIQDLGALFVSITFDSMDALANNAVRVNVNVSYELNEEEIEKAMTWLCHLWINGEYHHAQFIPS